MGDEQTLRWAKPLAYEAFMGRWSRKLAPVFLDFVGIDAGDRVLDVGSGTGSVVGAVLESGLAGEVVGLEPSDGFREFARARHPGARFEAGEAQSIPFPDDAFDRCLTMLVLNFVPEPHRAVEEMMRVSRPGGRAAAALWDYQDGMDMLRLFWDAAVELDPEAKARHEGQMRFSRPGDLGDLWRGVGFEEIEEAGLWIDTPFASFDDFWLPLLMEVGPAGAYVATLSDDRREALRQVLLDRLGLGPIDLRARAWAVRGRVPVG